MSSKTAGDVGAGIGDTYKTLSVAAYNSLMPTIQSNVCVMQ